jgi:DNA-binding transcriptional LysR family regulator
MPDNPPNYPPRSDDGSRRPDMMHLSSRINWNLLHTFVVLADCQNISRAAEVLRRGQPAVSAALKNLEDQVGHILIERGPRLFRLTEAGKLLYREAREICGSVDRIAGLLTDSTDLLIGNVRIVIASHMTSPIIDKAFYEFGRRYSRATLTVEVMNSRDIMEAMADRLLYFGIGPVFSKLSELEYFHIFKEHCGFYCGPPHPLFGRRDLRISDLENQASVTYRSAIDSDTLQSITDMRKSVRFADPIKGIANNLEEVRRMIIAGIGIGAIPVQIAARDVREGLLWRLPPYEDVMPIDVYLLTNPRVRPSKSELAFVSVLREIVDEIPLEKRTYRGSKDTRPGKTDT